MNKVGNRKMALKRCLESWKPIEEVLKEQLQSEKGTVEQMLSGPVSREDLDKLNTHVMKAAAIENVFLIVKTLEEEFNSSEPQLVN